MNNNNKKKKATPERGDLVATYILNSDLNGPKLLETGIVLKTRDVGVMGDQELLVYSISLGVTNWWNKKRWQLLSKKS